MLRVWVSTQIFSRAADGLVFHRGTIDLVKLCEIDFPNPIPGGATAFGFHVHQEGEPIPPVDPEDLRRRWNIKPPWDSKALLEAQK